MHQALKLVALAAAVNASPFPSPQGVTSKIAPVGAPPPDCTGSYNGKFAVGIQPLNVGKRDGDGVPLPAQFTYPPSLVGSKRDDDPKPGVYPPPFIGSKRGESPAGIPPPPITLTPSPVESRADDNSRSPLTYPWHPPSLVGIARRMELCEHPEQCQKDWHELCHNDCYQHCRNECNKFGEDHCYGSGNCGDKTVTVTAYCTEGNEYCHSVPPPHHQTTVVVPPESTVTVVTEIWDGQPQFPAGGNNAKTIYVSRQVAGQSGDGQPWYPKESPKQDTQQNSPSPTKTPDARQSNDGQVTEPTHSAQHQARDVAVSKFTHVKDKDICSPDTLMVTLQDGVMIDSHNRTAYIASNYQFQFDNPPQAGAMLTAGFSVCQDSTIALGPEKQWWRCRSGDFYNLYNTNWAPQCEPIHMTVVPANCPTPP